MEEEAKKDQKEESSFAFTSAKASEDKKASEDELKELEKKCNEYLNNWKRAQADFENYKKGELERTRFLIEYLKEAIMLSILPVLDNIYLAEKSVPESIKSDSWTEGFRQIKKQMEEFLKKEGIEEIETEGEKFNPETMEVIEVVPASVQASAGAVAEELQKGYMMGDKVIRPAKVKVTK